MTESTEEERRLVLGYPRQRVPLHPLKQEWGMTAEAILTAIERSSDLTQRGIQNQGWTAVTIVGDSACDFLLQQGPTTVRVQAKLQRRQRGFRRNMLRGLDPR